MIIFNMNTKKTMIVSEPALLARVNRKLAANGEVMRKTPEASRWLPDLGYYYIVDHRLNAIVRKDVCLEAEARRLGALKPHEEVAYHEVP